jgi:general secretion pathway protein G
MEKQKMSVKQHQGLLSNKKRGFTLVELMVTLGIMAVLAAIAVPYAETAMKRSKEMELTAGLRTIRTAIDKFNQDYKDGKISKQCNCASEEGYPADLKVLISGADVSGAAGGKIKYLRRIPRDPFADQSQPSEEQWGLRAYGDDPDSSSWSGRDVYDVYTRSEKKALDGSKYDTW